MSVASVSGVVVDKAQLRDREVLVIGNGRAVMLCPSDSLANADPEEVEVVHPNEVRPGISVGYWLWKGMGEKI
jgi:hypothetical protein